MQYISKAALDTVAGVNFARQDLSPVVTLLTEPGRPISSNAEEVRATNIIHQWDEQGRNKAGTGLTSFKEGALPKTQTTSPTRPQNVTCIVGELAQVTDQMAAEWTGAGSWKLADGEEVRQLTEALDLETELATLDTLDEIEFEHAYGDSSNPQAFDGGQTDGLHKWVLANGFNGQTGGSSSAPVFFTEAMLKDAARGISLSYAKAAPDTLLIPPELKNDINSFVGGGAGRPLVQMVGAGPNGSSGIVGGSDVAYYNTGYSIVKIEIEPWFSPNFNPYLGAACAILYNKSLVKNASLIKLGAEPLARTDTSVKKMVTATIAQEHRMAIHTAILPNIKSSIA